MTDRAMLELAAKAAGLKNHAWNDLGMRELAVHGVPHCGFQGPVWNPLDDDGDALRLANILKMEIIIDELGVQVLVESRHVAACINENVHTNVNILEARATALRLAITRAAAEIGKQMIAAQGEQ